MNNEVIKLKNEDLGYDVFFESNYKKLKLENISVARVTAEHRGVYKVKNTEGEYLAKITGKQMFNASRREDYPAVGDFVVITLLGREQAVIKGILPRKTVVKRRGLNKKENQIIATNIDVALIVESVGRDYSLNRFERYFTIANSGGIKSVAILNKIDLISREELEEKISQIKSRFENIDIIFTSAVADEGLQELKEYLKKGMTYCFLGSSGVGKSSLINRLLGKKAIKTEEIGVSANRGKHVTTKREMYFLENGSIVIDNPGMRDVGMTDTSVGIDDIFKKITSLSLGCKYSDCTHIHEPGCEVLAKLSSGELDADKYFNYVNLKKEVEFYKMTDFEKRDKNRKFGKFIKKAKGDLRKYVA
jgi:ribosome biogenesis GTPase